MRIFMRTCFMLLSACLAAAAAPGAQAADPPACRLVRFAAIGWTDNAATTGLAAVLLDGLGYRPVTILASAPIAFAGMRNKQIDVFLSDWSPVMDRMIEPFVAAHSLTVLPEPNLTGAKVTLAVPDYVYAAGLRSFADIHAYADKLGGRIYGIEPATNGNVQIQRMIDQDRFGLGHFTLVESSEAGMLAQVKRAIRSKQWIVFLGWAPHPMNVQMTLEYLAGGDAVFGPDDGASKVYTVTAADYAQRCPNAAQLIENLRFTTDMENQVMLSIVDKTPAKRAALQWLKANPQALEAWLARVRTFDGEDGLPAVKAYLDSH